MDTDKALLLEYVLYAGTHVRECLCVYIDACVFGHIYVYMLEIAYMYPICAHWKRRASLRKRTNLIVPTQLEASTSATHVATRTTRVGGLQASANRAAVAG